MTFMNVFYIYKRRMLLFISPFCGEGEEACLDVLKGGAWDRERPYLGIAWPCMAVLGSS